MRRTLLLLLPALAAACAGPKVETAQLLPVAPPASWRTDAGPSGPADKAWWATFGDPALSALVEKALANNLDIAAAGTRIREARAEETLARAALAPSLDFTGTVAHTRSVNSAGRPVIQTAGQPQVVASWEIDFFGRLSDRASAARASWLASEAAREAVRLSVAAAAASGYVTLCALDARLAIAQDTLRARGEALLRIRRRNEAGYSPRLELAQAEAEYEATAVVIPQIQQAIVRQENALSVLSGEVPGHIARSGTLENLREPLIPDGLPSQLLRRRPDVAQAELQLAASDRRLAAARKNYLPQVRLTGSGGQAVSSLLGDPISIWSLGASVLAPLFEGGKLRAGTETAAAQRDQAAFTYRKAALNAFREVEDALAAASSSDRQAEILKRQQKAAGEGLELAANRYRAGYSPYLEELDAQRNLFGVQLALVQAEADALTARVALYMAMGGGWSQSADEKPGMPAH